MKKFLAFGMIAAVVVVCGSAKDENPGAMNGGDLSAQKKVPEKLTGVKAPSDMKLAELPEGAYFEVKDSLGVYYERATKAEFTKRVVAYFQEGRQVYGIDHDAWDYSGPAMDTRYKTCAIVVDLDHVEAQKKAGKSFQLFEKGTQFIVGKKEVNGAGDRGVVTFKISPQVGSIIDLNCDKMPVKTFEEYIFGKNVEVYLPAGQ